MTVHLSPILDKAAVNGIVNVDLHKEQKKKEGLSFSTLLYNNRL